MSLTKTLPALATLAALSVPGAAQAFDGRFYGGGTISNYTQACRNAGWALHSEAYTVTYSPAGIGGNPGRDAITFLNDNHSMGFEHPTGSFTGTFQPVSQGGMFRQPWFIWHEQDNAALLRVTARNPTNVNANTAGTVRLRGQIRNFVGITNCRVDFDVIVQHRR